MFYPKDITEFVLSQPDLAARFGKIIETRNRTRGAEEGGDSLQFEYWMFAEGFERSPAVKRYVVYLCAIRAQMEIVDRFYRKTNPGREGQKDEYPVMTEPEQMFHLANALYVLDSYGVKGDLLECGAFKGFSSCCLSWACHRLGRKLIVADSFEGLPAPKLDFEQGYYEANDFKGSLDEVKSNLEAFGRIDAVEFVKGFYEDSLQGFDRPLAMLWIDVDLYQSTMDVLNNVYAKLSPGGVIFSDEVPIEEIGADGLFTSESKFVTRALKEYFEQHNIAYRALHLKGYIGVAIPGAQEKPVRLLEQVRFLWRLSMPLTAYAAEDLQRRAEEELHKVRASEAEVKQNLEESRSHAARLAQREREHQLLLQSKSLKLGRLLTAPYRAVKSLFK